jgi:hypothetical protein
MEISNIKGIGEEVWNARISITEPCNLDKRYPKDNENTIWGHSLYNGWSKQGVSNVMCKVKRQKLEQEQGRRQEDKVLKSPIRRLDTKITRGNQSIKESI